jgi:hypothetical protein
MPSLHIRLDDDEFETLKQRAAAEGETVSEVGRQLMRLGYIADTAVAMDQVSTWRRGVDRAELRAVAALAVENNQLLRALHDGALREMAERVTENNMLLQAIVQGRQLTADDIKKRKPAVQGAAAEMFDVMPATLEAASKKRESDVTLQLDEMFMEGDALEDALLTAEARAAQAMPAPERIAGE